MAAVAAASAVAAWRAADGGVGAKGNKLSLDRNDIHDGHK